MKTCVLVGAGSRITFQYALPLFTKFSDHIKIVGIVEPNRLRAEKLNERLNYTCRIYTEFEEMMNKEHPDMVIIGSPDAYHHEYIIKALSHGVDVVCEKPITIDAEKAQAIIDAEKKYKKEIRVIFNYRFTAFATRIKQLLQEYDFGPITTVHFEWHLDRQHGADYFRRWHREMKNSGGLLVHKSTHHFDLVNWLLHDEPEQVFAYGGLKMYGRKNAPYYGTTCRTCSHSHECPFYIDFTADPFIENSFFKCEQEDQYFRDSCVFSDVIDIYDTASVLVRYKKGTKLTYSFNAYSPYEGYRLVITGKRGRIEAEDFHGLVGYYKNQQIYQLRYYNLNEEKIDIHIAPQTGSHGGGDDKMMKMIFGNFQDDPYGHLASSRDGILSAMIGIAANKSIATGKPQNIADQVVF
jgi:hypothetical protein